MKLTNKLGIALVAVLAVSAVVASNASAALEEFKSTSSPVMLFGAQKGKHTFTVDGSSVECTTANFEAASVTSPAKTVQITPTYEGCTAFTFAKAKVEMKGCVYEFLQPNSLVGNVKLVCGANKIRIFVSSFGTECEVLIGETNNTNLSKVTYKNEAGSPTKVLVGANVTGITAEKTKDTGLCPLKGTGTVNNAVYEGETLVEGTAGIGISVG
jgi:hypothetical protein